MFDNRDESKGLVALVLVLILIFAVFIGLYLSSLDTSGQTYKLTLTTIHNNVELSIFNPLLIGKSTINKGTTSFTLPRGNYSIRCELHRDYSEPVVWTKSFTLDRDLEVKLFD